MYFFFLWLLKANPEGNGFKILNFESSKENVFILVSETSTLSEVAMNFEKNLLFRRTLPSLLQSSRVGIGFWRATRFFYEIIWATNQTTSTQAKKEQTERPYCCSLSLRESFCKSLNTKSQTSLGSFGCLSVGRHKAPKTLYKCSI